MSTSLYVVKAGSFWLRVVIIDSTEGLVDGTVDPAMWTSGRVTYLLSELRDLSSSYASAVQESKETGGRR